jgi:hypothetical protein
MSVPHQVEVVVRGRLGPELTAALQDFDIGPAPDGCTRLLGRIPDQTRLMGLLSMLDELHIEVVSVNPVPAPGEL